MNSVELQRATEEWEQLEIKRQELLDRVCKLGEVTEDDVPWAKAAMPEDEYVLMKRTLVRDMAALLRGIALLCAGYEPPDAYDYGLRILHQFADEMDVLLKSGRSVHERRRLIAWLREQGAKP